MFTVSSLPGFKGEVGAGGRVAEEQLALGVLHHWDQVARVYCTVLYCIVLYCTLYRWPGWGSPWCRGMWRPGRCPTRTSQA